MHGNIRYELSETHARLIEAKRKIPADIAVEMGLVSYGQDSIAFEYRRNGKCEFRKVMRAKYHSDGTREKSFHIDPPGATLFPFNLDSLSGWSRRQDVLIITEGEMDACAVRAAGEAFVISVPNGANRDKIGEGAIDPLNDGGFSWLWQGPRLLPTINCFEKIILAVDNDAKGLVLREELAVRLGKQRCFGVSYPEGCKDANDVLVHYGEEALQDVLLNAKPLVPDKLVSFRDLPGAREIIEYPVWPEMKEHLRINIPELMIVTGAPGSGKSVFTLNLCAQLAETYNMPGAILQFEDQPQRNYADLVRFRLRNIKEPTDDDRARAEIWVEEMFRTVAPAELLEEEEDYTFQWLRDAIWEAVKRHGAMWVLADPFNEIEHCFGINETETRYMNEALRQIKRMARTFNILIIIVVHPTKQAGQQRDIEAMSTYDAAGSAAFKNKADHGIIVYRPEGSQETLIKVDKCKNHRTMGVPGIVRMVYDAGGAEFRFVGKYVALLG